MSHPAVRSRQDDDPRPGGEDHRCAREGEYPSPPALAWLAGACRGLACGLRLGCRPRLLGRSLPTAGFAGRSYSADGFCAGWLSAGSLLAGEPPARRPARPFPVGRRSGHDVPAGGLAAGSRLAVRLAGGCLAGARPAGLYPCCLAARTAATSGTVRAAVGRTGLGALVARSDHNAAARAGGCRREAAQAGVGVLRRPVFRTGELRPPVPRVSELRPAIACSGGLRPAQPRIGAFRRESRIREPRRPEPRIGELRPSQPRIGELRPSVRRISTFRPIQPRVGTLGPIQSRVITFRPAVPRLSALGPPAPRLSPPGPTPLGPPAPRLSPPGPTPLGPATPRLSAPGATRSRVGALGPIERGVAPFGPAILRIGRNGLAVAAGTEPLRARAAASGLLLAVGPWLGLTTVRGAGPLSRNGGRLGLRRPSSAQVLEPLVVGVVTEAAGASVPLLLILPGRRIPRLLRDRLTRVILVPGSPWLRDGLRNSRFPRLAESLRRRPLPGITLPIGVLPPGVLPPGVLPPGVLPPGVLPPRVRPGRRAFAFSRPGFVIRGVRRPLVLLVLRPSAAHKVSYP